MAEILLNSKVWLGSQIGRVVKTITYTSESGTTVEENGKTLIKAGTLINDATMGYGFVVNDVDVTDGPRIGQLMIRGEFINSGLPSSLSTSQRNTLASTGLRDIEQSVLQLFVQPVEGTEVLFGKAVSSLQENIIVGASQVNGTLAYVEGYTGFSSKVEEQSGHYLALKATAMDGATITAQVINGFSGPVTLDTDGMIVIRVANNSQSIRFTATYGDDTEVVEYAFTNLTLVPQTFTITSSITNGSATGSQTIVAGGTATVTISANTGYVLPSSVTVTGATNSYDSSTGVISLSSPTGNVSIEAICDAQVVPQFTQFALNDVIQFGDKIVFDSSMSYSDMLTFMQGLSYEMGDGACLLVTGVDENQNVLTVLNAMQNDDKYMITIGYHNATLIWSSFEDIPRGISLGWQNLDNDGSITLRRSLFQVDSVTVNLITDTTPATWNGIIAGFEKVDRLVEIDNGDTVQTFTFNTELAADTVKDIVSDWTGWQQSTGYEYTDFMQNTNNIGPFNIIRASGQNGYIYAIYVSGTTTCIWASEAFDFGPYNAPTAGWQTSNLTSGTYTLQNSVSFGTFNGTNLEWNGYIVGKQVE